MEQVMIPAVESHCNSIDAKIRGDELDARQRNSALECRPDDAGKLPPKIEPYSAKWERVATNLALSYAPSSYPCAACEYPVLKGMVCQFCHTMNPEGA